MTETVSVLQNFPRFAPEAATNVPRLEALPAESVPDEIEVEEIALPDLRHSWQIMRERMTIAKANVRAVGALALGRVDRAATVLDEAHAGIEAGRAPKPWVYQPPTLRQQYEDFVEQRKIESRRRRLEIRNNILIGATALAIAVGSTVGLAEYINRR